MKIVLYRRDFPKIGKKQSAEEQMLSLLEKEVDRVDRVQHRNIALWNEGDDLRGFDAIAFDADHENGPSIAAWVEAPNSGAFEGSCIAKKMTVIPLSTKAKPKETDPDKGKESK